MEKEYESEQQQQQDLVTNYWKLVARMTAIRPHLTDMDTEYYQMYAAAIVVVVVVVVVVESWREICSISCNQPCHV